MQIFAIYNYFLFCVLGLFLKKNLLIVGGILCFNTKVYHCKFEEVSEVNETLRGEGGFGSTGNKLK